VLVPDALTIRIVSERTAQPDCRSGYVLDGFPRTPAQAEMLEGLAAEQGHTLGALLVDVPFDILEKRVTGRLSCPICGEIYNVYFKPPARDEVCDFHPETRLNRRADDNAETIKARLATYERDTQPLLDFYERSGRLRRVDGTRDAEAIYADIEKAVTGEP
jgi:adenylate kinase